MNKFHTNKKKPVKKILPLAFIFFLFFYGLSGADIRGDDIPAWRTFQTEYTTIYYQDMEDLGKFHTRIKYPGPSSAGENLTADIGFKVDTLFERTQSLLDMQGFITPVNVKIFKNKQQLDKAFFSVYKKKGSIRAWYTHDELTVYLQVNDLHAGILAHEFAHAVMDQFMIIPPPGKVAEILARYVDEHLLEDNLQKPGEFEDTLPVLGYSEE